MICHHCGRELADNVMFCPSCGTQQRRPEQQPQQTPAPEQPAWQSPAQEQPAWQDPAQQPAWAMPTQPYQTAQQMPGLEKKKSKAPLIIIICVVAVAAIFAALWFGLRPMLQGDSLTEELGEYVEDQMEGITTGDMDASADYAAIFESYGIVDVDAPMPGMETDCYALDNGGSGIIKIQFGYNSDVIQEWFETDYYDISAYSQDELELFESQVNDLLDVYRALDFCTVETEVVGDYYVLRLQFKDLQKVENVDEMTELDLVEDGSGQLLSFSLSEEDLISNGYVKK